MGKHKYIKVEQLYPAFEKYKEEIKNNPITKVEYVGKDGNKVNTPIERPLTVEGFHTFCHKTIGDIHHYWINYEDRYVDYLPIITRIRGEIRQDQIEKGMAGIYNSNLTARLNGLYDKQEITTTSTIQLLNNDPLDDSKDKI